MKKLLIILFFFCTTIIHAQTVRSLIGTDTVSLSKRINRIDVFLIAGQSNAQGQGDSTGGIKIVSGRALQYYSSTLSTITGDPVGNALTGSAWPAFINNYYNITGIKVCLVPTAIASTSQTYAANGGAGTWDTGGTLFNTSVTALNAALTALRAAGYTPNLRGILWCQGEIDGGSITATTITKAQYKTALQTMIANYRTQLGRNLPFYIFRTGGNGTTGPTQVRDAQEEVAAADYFTDVVFRNAVDFPSRSLQNGAHYFQAGYDEMGAWGAINVIDGAEERSYTAQSTKFGIGTKFPTSTLHVVGTAGFDSLFYTRGTALTANQVWAANSSADGMVGVSVNGTGSIAKVISPSFTTPTLGAATATSINGNTFTTGTYTLTGTAGKTLTFSNSVTIAGTDATVMTFPSTSATIARTDAANTFTGANVFSTGALINASSNTFKTTNGGSNVAATPFIVDLDGSVSTAGSQAITFETANGLGFTHANGTRRILGAAIKLANLTNTANSEASDLSFSTQSGGTALSEKMKLLAAGGLDFPTTTTPAPASGHAVLWFDGTNFKVTKNVGGSTTTGTVF